RKGPPGGRCGLARRRARHADRGAGPAIARRAGLIATGAAGHIGPRVDILGARSRRRRRAALAVAPAMPLVVPLPAPPAPPVAVAAANTRCTPVRVVVA